MTKVWVVFVSWFPESHTCTEMKGIADSLEAAKAVANGCCQELGYTIPLVWNDFDEAYFGNRGTVFVDSEYNSEGKFHFGIWDVVTLSDPDAARMTQINQDTSHIP